jgi:hypothetical protein
MQHGLWGQSLITKVKDHIRGSHVRFLGSEPKIKSAHNEKNEEVGPLFGLWMKVKTSNSGPLR